MRRDAEWVVVVQVERSGSRVIEDHHRATAVTRDLTYRRGRAPFAAFWIVGRQMTYLSHHLSRS